jgi:hypothetical protein
MQEAVQAKDLPPLDVDAANVFSQSERILQEHVRRHNTNSTELKDPIQRVLHHPDFIADRAAMRPGSRWSRLWLPPPPTSARSRPRHQSHGTVPRSRSPRTFPQDHVPVRCLVSVTIHRSRPLITPGGHVPRWSPAPITAQRSRPPIARVVVTIPSPPHDPLVTSRISGHIPLLTPGCHGPTLPHVPWVTSPFPPHVPWSRPPPPRQFIPLHMMRCSDWQWGTWLMGVFMAPSSKPGAGSAWLVGTLRHFTPSVALVRALGPPASSPAGAAVQK